MAKNKKYSKQNGRFTKEKSDEIQNAQNINDTMEMPPLNGSLKKVKKGAAKNKAKARVTSKQIDTKKAIPADIFEFEENPTVVDEIVNSEEKHHDPSVKGIAKQVKKVRKDFNRKFTILCVSCIAVVVICIGAVIATNVYYQNSNDQSQSDEAISPTPSPSQSKTPSESPTSTPTPSETPSESPSATPSETHEAATFKNVNGTTVKLSSSAISEDGMKNEPGWTFVQKALVSAGYPQQSTKEAYNVAQIGDLKQIVPFTKIAQKVSGDYRAGDILMFGRIGDVPIFSEYMGIYLGDDQIEISLGREVKKVKLSAVVSNPAYGNPTVAYRMD